MLNTVWEIFEGDSFQLDLNTRTIFMKTTHQQ